MVSGMTLLKRGRNSFCLWKTEGNYIHVTPSQASIKGLSSISGYEFILGRTNLNVFTTVRLYEMW